MAITREKAEKDGMLGGGAPELKNKDKIDWETVESQELTVKEVVETTNADGERLIAVIFEEYPTNFFWAGATITKWYDNYGEEFIGTVIEVGPMVKTKKGQNCRSFTIV